METDDDSLEAELPAVLENTHRRYLMYCLYLYANPVRLSDIAYQVTVWEDDAADVDVATRCHRTYMSLYHDHLPMLTDAGLVTYDQETDTVTLCAPDAVLPALERRLSREMDTLLAAEQTAFGAPIPDTLPEDLYRALAVPERRAVLSYLLDESEATFAELTDAVASAQTSDGDSADPDTRERVRKTLHHVHLPLLQDTGLVRYDRSANRVELASLSEAVRETVLSATRPLRLTRTDTESN